MKAEIISVGTELLLGHTINSDAAYVARELALHGIDIMHMQVVGDNGQRLFQALEEAATRAEIIITTGGLGPTGDDLTKDIVAKFAGLPLQEDSESMARIREYFAGRPMSANQIRQAMLPAGATIFANEVGTAPGCAVHLEDGKIIILLPGPPRELIPMLEKQVRPYLAKINRAVTYSVMVRTFGIGEGLAAEKLAELLDGANPTAATYAGNGEVMVKVTAKADNEAAARAMTEPLVAAICQRLGDVVYSTEEPSLESTVVKKLTALGKTVTTAESCTGGLLTKRITDVPGASAVFHLGLVTYANEAKEHMLSVPRELLAQYGAVSPQVAVAMAAGAREQGKSDFGIGITGIAGPDGGTPEKPVGLVYIALVWQGGTWLKKLEPEGRYLGRQRVRTRSASMALDMLRRRLFGLPFENSQLAK